MKKTISKGVSLIIAAVMCLSLLPMTALAADSEFLITDNGVINYYGAGGDIVIPNGVTSIPLLWCSFGNQSKITSITIPDSVTSIGPAAFYDFSGLMSVTIPNSVKSIGYNAFGNCSSLTSITIPGGVTKIENGTFGRCISLTSVTIPDSVTSIGGLAFIGCTSLTSITIPDSVTSIDYRAFEECENLKNVTIGKGVTSISEAAFANCTSLTSVTIPDCVTSIDFGAFNGCTSLTSVIIGNGATSIKNNVFGGCTSLTSVTIPDSVTSIDGQAFVGCGKFAIYGNDGSFAQKYAQNSNRPFVATGGTAKPTEPTIEKPSGWAEEQVNAAITNNLVPQDLQTKYTQATTRAEFAALAVTLYEQVTGTTITERKTFDDTTDINVEKAAAIGVVSGVGNNKFDPNAGLTREQAATMLSRLANATGKPLTQQAAAFNDNSSISTWAFEAVGQMQTSGIMGGVGNNTFDPKGAYTREQSIITIMRLYDILKGNTGNANSPPPTSNALNGTYQWKGYDGNNSADMIWVYVFKSDGTVTHSQDYAGGENLRSASGTYTLNGDKVVTTTGHDYFGITYNSSNDTIKVSGVFGDRVFEKVK